MKRPLILLIVLTVFWALQVSAHADEYVCNGIDGITLSGNEYSDISNLWDQSDPDVEGWFIEGDTIISGWADQWAEYTATLSPGKWQIGLNAINQWGPLPSGYVQFEVLANFFDPDAQQIMTDIMEIPASDEEAFYGFIDVDIYLDGEYTVRYTWLNDAYVPGAADANIQIISVFFCKFPELVKVDIKPGSCPNPLNTKSKGVLPVAILGTEDFDVNAIDPSTIRLSMEGVEEEIAPLRWNWEDVGTPFNGASDDDCLDCTRRGPDGFTDLTLKFDTQEVVSAIGEVYDGDCLDLTIVGELLDGFPIEGSDLAKIIHKINNSEPNPNSGKNKDNTEE